jgi:dTDP-4-dehydrorhamnose 3,5-epimerase
MSDFGIEIKTSKVFPEVKIVKTEPWYDYRGEMWTTWESEWDILPEGNEWKISKFTRSRKNVLRGLHGDDVTWKFVHCVYGEIYQVVVDNRPESENYQKWLIYHIVGFFFWQKNFHISGKI